MPILYQISYPEFTLNNALQQHMQQIELQLKLNPWIAGEYFSAADILVWFPLFACAQLDQDNPSVKGTLRLTGEKQYYFTED